MKKILFGICILGAVIADEVPTTPLVLPTAAPTSGWGYYGFADVLYWHADLDETDWASKNTNFTNATFFPQHNYDLKFKWNWAFRLGMGANTDFDHWDTRAYYTWFHTENSRAAGVHTTPLVQQVEDLNTQLGGFKQGKIHWDLSYSVVDVDVGRWFYVSKALAFRPLLGAKAAFISQDIHRKFLFDSFTPDFAKAFARDKSRFWGVGMCGGFNTRWTLGHLKSHYFTIFGDLSAAFLYGHFHLTHKERTIDAQQDALKVFSPAHLSRNAGVPTLQGILGFGWDTTFNANTGTIQVKLGYEFNYWFKQLHRLTNEVFTQQATARVVKFDRYLGDLALQGLTLDCRLDF